MRCLILFLLSSFLFIAPFQGNAGEVLKKQTGANVENSTGFDKLIEYSVSTDFIAIITSSQYHKIANSSYRFYPLINLINTVALKNGRALSYQKRQLARPYVYCKRIGLTLIFPEHYYW